jgi:hypothetical protein
MAYSTIKSILNRDLAKEICSYLEPEELDQTFYETNIVKNLNFFQVAGFCFTDYTRRNGNYVQAMTAYSKWQNDMWVMIGHEQDLIGAGKDGKGIKLNRRWRELRMQLLVDLAKIAGILYPKKYVFDVNQVYGYLYSFASTVYKEAMIDDVSHLESPPYEPWHIVGLDNITKKVMNEAFATAILKD